MALLLVGCGRMGSALAKGWLKAGMNADDLWVIEPVAVDLPCHHVTDAARLPHGIAFETVVLAVKPQMMAAVLDQLKPHVPASALVLSIAAGITIARIRAGLDACQSVIRAMPNTPAAIGAGITGYYAADVSAADKARAVALLEAGGKVVEVTSERQIDAVTALSGSGPAYIFHFVECLAEAGEALGLEADTAMTLAREMVIGAGALMRDDSSPPASLREAVTSPAGTTAAALAVFMKDQALAHLTAEAVAAADRRAEELSR